MKSSIDVFFTRLPINDVTLVCLFFFFLTPPPPNPPPNLFGKIVLVISLVIAAQSTVGCI